MYLNDPEISYQARMAGIDPENTSMMLGYLAGVRIAHDLSTEQWDALSASEVAKLCADLQASQEQHATEDLLDRLTTGIAEHADEAGSNDDHIGDLEKLLAVAWAVMTPQQQQLVAESPIGRKALRIEDRPN